MSGGALGFHSHTLTILIGIGLHVGDAFCGAVGDEARLEFSVLGDTVNVAARLEQETKAVGLRLVVSRDVLAAGKGTFEVLAAG
jgi:adenylate cyclase